MKGYASFIVFFYIYFLSRIQKEANGCSFAVLDLEKKCNRIYIKHD